MMGAGKSGSTIFGVTLGNCEGVFYAGELFHWLVKSGVAPFEGDERARFWEEVREQAGDPEGLFGREAVRYLERSLSLFRIHRWRARRRLRPRYRRVAESLYRAIASTAHATHIVDTSHFPLRARELRAIEGIDLYLLLLIRDPASVVRSYTRHGEGGLLRRGMLTLNTNADLWLTYLLSLLVFLSHRPERRLLVRYEEFIADPEGVLADILARVESRAPIPNLAALKTGNPLQGNRLLGTEVVALRPNADPPPKGSPLTRLLQLPWAVVLPRLRPKAHAASPPGRYEHERALA